MTETRVDPGTPSIGSEIESSLFTLSPRGPWFYVILALSQIGTVFLVTRASSWPFDITLATVFAGEGIVCVVIASILTGQEGGIRGGLIVRRAQVVLPGGTDRPPYCVEVRRGPESTNMSTVLALVAYGGALMVIAFYLAL